MKREKKPRGCWRGTADKGPGKREVEMKRGRVDAMHTQDCPVICLQYIKT